MLRPLEQVKDGLDKKKKNKKIKRKKEKKKVGTNFSLLPHLTNAALLPGRYCDI
jgi:hypothetical protein